MQWKIEKIRKSENYSRKVQYPNKKGVPGREWTN